MILNKDLSLKKKIISFISKENSKNLILQFEEEINKTDNNRLFQICSDLILEKLTKGIVNTLTKINKEKKSYTLKIFPTPVKT